MNRCDDIAARRALAMPLAPEEADHAATCERCLESVEAIHAVVRALPMAPRPGPPALLTRRVLSAAGPALAHNAEREIWRRVARAVAASVVPLPVILALDAWGLRTAHRLLSTVLPDALSLWVIGSYALLLALCLGLTYGAVPLLAARQIGPTREVAHA